MLKNRKDQATLGPNAVVNWKKLHTQGKEKHKLYRTYKQEKALKKAYRQEKALENAKKVIYNPKSPLASSENDANAAVRDYTVSIAVPGSILDNAQSPELKTYLAGQIARAAAVYNVNEIIVFNELGIPNLIEEDDQSLKLRKKNHGCVQMVRILQFLECPQYLRKYYFPLHKDLEYAGLLNPLDMPHHLRVDDESEFREGIIMNKPVKEGRGSFVYIGLRKTAIIDKVLESNVRVTVQLNKEQTSKKHFKGKAVSPSVPFKCANLYWGYRVRLANNLSSVFSECPFKGGYDVTVGTSEKGSSVDSFQLPSFKHLLIVFGGLRGLESCLEGDETIDAVDPKDLFNFYLNTCPNQGSRAIRTEEAVLITLASLRPEIQKNEVSQAMSS